MQRLKSISVKNKNIGNFQMALLTLIVWLVVSGNPQHKLEKMFISTCGTAEKGAENIREKDQFCTVFLYLRFMF